MGVNRNLFSDYAGATGEGGCWPKSDDSCAQTIFEAIRGQNVGGVTHSSAGAPGAHDHSDPSKFLAAALAVAKAADIVVLAVGNARDGSVGTPEHEGTDRPDVNLTVVNSAKTALMNCFL